MAAGIGGIFTNLFERLLLRLPGVRAVYAAVKQVSDFFFSERDIQFTRIVAVEYPRKGVWSMGFVTSESLAAIRDAASEPVLAVLIPYSPLPVTGCTITVRKSECVDLNITFDQACQFIVSCGVVVPSLQVRRWQQKEERGEGRGEKERGERRGESSSERRTHASSTRNAGQHVGPMAGRVGRPQLHRHGIAVDLVPITTTGNQHQAAILSIGGEGIFTKEIQRALLDGRIDLAVHSLKDLPTGVTPGLVLAAVPERAAVADALVCRDKAVGSLCCRRPAEFRGRGKRLLLSVAAGGAPLHGRLRRRAQLCHARPDLQMKDVRGNVETRLGKLQQGDFDALILAEAGLRRLGLARHIAEVLPLELMLPAVGQGALGLETRVNDVATRQIVAALDDPSTHAAVLAERAMLARLQGGCLEPSPGSDRSRAAIRVRRPGGRPRWRPVARSPPDGSRLPGGSARSAGGRSVANPGGGRTRAGVAGRLSRPVGCHLAPPVLVSAFRQKGTAKASGTPRHPIVQLLGLRSAANRSPSHVITAEESPPAATACRRAGRCSAHGALAAAITDGRRRPRLRRPATAVFPFRRP